MMKNVAANLSDDDIIAVSSYVASLDLDGDSTDELVLEASYRLGTAFKVISASGGNYRETYTSYYRGPA